MKAEKNLSFLEVMKNGLIRKNILTMIPTVDDVQNLAKTCKMFHFLINNDIIRRKLLWYKDEQHIVVKPTEYFRVHSFELGLNGVDFVSIPNYQDLLNKTKTFYGEITAASNTICVVVQHMLRDNKHEQSVLFFEELVRRMNLNFQSRKDANVIDFTGNYFRDSSIILHSLCFIEHENIKKIKINESIFMYDYKECGELLRDIFGGFPKLEEIVIVGNFNQTNYYRFLENQNILECVFKGLSKKKGATIIVVAKYNRYEILVLFSTIFLTFAEKYGIKLKFSLLNYFPLPVKTADKFYSVKYCIRGSRRFLKDMESFQALVNLKKLVLSFKFSDIKKGLQRMDKLDSHVLSFKHCKQLKIVEIYFEGYEKKMSDLRATVFNNNLEYLASLMPDSVERLVLVKGFHLTYEVAETINKFMPNLKSLTTFEVSYKDFNCLCAFKNLQVLITFDNVEVEIPSTVKCLAVLRRSPHDRSNTDLLSPKLLNAYITRFNKFFDSTEIGYIFFNDIVQLEMYKHVILEIFD